MNQKNSVLVTRYVIEASVEQVSYSLSLSPIAISDKHLGNAFPAEEKTDDRGDWQ
jgi:hypothetical protein